MHLRSTQLPCCKAVLCVLTALVTMLPMRPVEAQVMRLPTTASPKSKSSALKWPKANHFKKELSRFEDVAITQSWAQETRQLVDYLYGSTEVLGPDAASTIAALQNQAKAIDSFIDYFSKDVDSSGQLTAESGEMVSELQRFKYRLERRIEVWVGVIKHARAVGNAPRSTPSQVSLARLPKNLDQILQQENPHSVGWQDYLAWDALIEAASVTNQDKKAKAVLRNAARKFLARYYSPSLTDNQREQFQPMFSPEVISAIRNAATREVNYYKLLTMMEGLEGNKDEKYPIGQMAHYMNDEYQNLLWADDPVSHELAETINVHWRNANVRVAINERMLNQLLPKTPATTESVSERLQGANVSGQNLIENEVRIVLDPNPNEISLNIETIGQVTSDTIAKRSGFTFQNIGFADFFVLKKLVFSRTGIKSEAPKATSTAKQRLVGLRGNLDKIPLIGKLSRTIAKQKAEEATPEAEQLTRQRVEVGAKQRVEKEVSEQVRNFRQGMQEHVLSRLISIDLEPDTVQLSTSKHRIAGRYIISGRDQMAAWQPRPTDYESDLMTIQFHQSAINNLIHRFDLNGREFNAESLARYIEQITGVPYESKQAGADATFTFAKYDAIRVDFEEGLASVTFRFRSFQIGKGRPWRNISIKANYVPSYIGTRIVLDLENQFEIKPDTLSLGDNIAIRGAFKAILENQYAFDLLPAVVREKFPNLAFAIDRFSLADGWCGVAIENAAKVNRDVPIVSPEEVIPGSWSDQLGSFRPRVKRVESPRTARRLDFNQQIR